MFDNIGKKIKTYAEVVCWIGIVVCIIIGVILMVLGGANEAIGTIIAGLLVALVGCLTCWISSFVIYGFGQLVENSDIIAKTLAPNYKEEMNDNKKIKEISDAELERISNEYSDWMYSIEALSNDELQERINSDDWDFEYRALCKKELENRM